MAGYNRGELMTVKQLADKWEKDILEAEAEELHDEANAIRECLRELQAIIDGDV
jgi:hypothetical protein